MRYVFITALLAFTLHSILTQAQVPEVGSAHKQESPWGILAKNNKEGLYLKTYLKLTGNPSYLEGTTTPFEKANYYDVLVQLYNYFGEYGKSAEAEDKFLGEISKVSKTVREDRPALAESVISQLQMAPAVEALEAAARDHPVIMINEEHRNSAHRELTLQLLTVLYKKGFRYLALETLSSTDSLLNHRKYPVTGTGYYTHDPVFGEVVRKALQIGFKVVGYDFAWDKGYMDKVSSNKPFARDNARDSIAARIIIDSILKDDPQAKILVHAGRSHAGRFKMQGLAMLAWHFKEYAGINPFCVDQVSMSPFFNPADENPIYQYAQQKFKFKVPVVFKKEDGTPWSEKSEYDMTVFTPKTWSDRGTPAWLMRSGERKLVRIDFTKLGLPVKHKTYRGSSPLTLQVRYLGENDLAIPAQQLLLLPGHQVPSTFVLFKGTYKVAVRDVENKILAGYSQQVR